MEENYKGMDLNGLEIAVIGMAGRFPGARNLDEFWENLKEGKESISFFTDEELEGSGVDRALLENPHYVKSNSFLEDKEYFDASFFGYLPNEAEIMDPQIRLFHECAWETLENAGYNPDIYKGLIGVYAGIGPSFYWEALTLMSGKSEVLGVFESSQLSNKDYLCTRISYKLNLKGPSFVVDTACSTSLVTIHLACQGLLNGECDMALAGGVKISHLGQPGYLYQEGMIMSPDGHCRAFDEKANGTVSGEGIGIALLKRLEDAVKDRDFIHALIKGSAINNDGIQKVGYAAPGVRGQMQVIKSALHMAEVEPESIGYIETHGTGTVLGDPIEIKALKRAFASNKKRFCALGSVKTNVGHLDRAAGAAGFIKTVLALKHRQIPPSLHFETPNLELGLEDSPFYVNNRLCQWKNEKYPLRAGVSSFGFGGTNAHVVLEAWSMEHGAGSEEEKEYQLILLSAKTQTALDKMTENLVNYFKKNPVNPKNPVLPDVAYTLQVGRQPFKYRRMTIGAHFDETVQTFSVKRENIPVVFMFPGQGSQYVDMALDLYHSEPVFREEMDRCFDILTPLLGYDIKEILYPSNRSNKSDINQTESAQPVIFALEYSLAKLLMKWGIRPHAMIGHSIGEYVAACISGVFSLEDALLLVAWRGKLMQQMPFGAMLSVPMPENEIKPLLDDQLSLAAVNGVSHCVVSGPEAQVELLAKKLKEDGQNSRLLHTSHAFHSAMMEPVLKAFAGKLEQVRFNEPKIPYISNLTGVWITIEAAANPDYWTRHLRETVRFADGLKELLKEENCVFVEVGPGKALSTFVRQHPAKTTGYWVLNLIKHPKEAVKDDYFLLSKVGQLWLYGVHIDWFVFHGAEKRHRIPLPTYPFERQRFWIEGSPFDIGREMLAGKPHLEKQKDIADWDLGSLLEQPLEYETIEPAVSPVLRQRPELSTSYQAPQNETEQQLVEVWQSFFGFQPVGTLDDFFELGGDSLKIITVVSRIHKELEVEVPLAEFFAHPNIRNIASYIEKSASKNLYLSIEPVEEKEYYPLTADLLRMYILNELEGVSTAYNLPLAIKIEGRLDKSRFEEAFRQLIKRHESLRTSFRMKGEYPVQVIHKEVDFRVRYLDESAGSSWSTDEIKDMARRFSQPFDLAQAPLLRVVLVRLSENEHLLFLDMHHIISDGISTTVLVREFRDLYMGGELPELRIQYKDFSEWLRCLFESGEIKKQEDYWLECFKGDVPVLNMPTDYPRPAVQSFEGDKIRFFLAEAFSHRLRSFIRGSGATLYMVLLAAYDILLSRYTGQGDIVVGSPVAGRNHTELEHVIGMFLKILVMRNEPSGNKTFNGFLGEVRNTTLMAYENQLYPFRDLVEKIGAGNDLSRNPLFDAMLLVQNIDAPPTDIEGLTFTPYDVNTGFSKVDLFLEATDTIEGIHLSFEYCTRLFKKNTIERFTGHFVNILEEVVKNPETRLADIDILDRGEKRQLLEEFNHCGHLPAVEWQKPVQRLFEEQVDRTPDRIALVAALHRLTYRTYRTHRTYITYLSYKTLNEASNRLARLLRKKGIGVDRIVALLMDRSVEMIIAILGTLKAGGVFLPIDPEYPKKRILYILEESRAAILLTKEEISKHIPFTSLAGLNSVELEPRVTAKRPQIKDFNSLPLPNRSLVDYEKYHQYIGEALARHTTTIQATRGCPFRCAFCHKIWPKNHVYRSAENIFHEVKTLYDIGARRFMFVDDIFNLQKENCTRFFELIIKNGLKVQLFFANGLRGDILTRDMMDLMVEAGTVDFDFSLESASPRMQKLMQKNLDIEKLRETINYLITHHPHVIIELQTMIGFPTETEQEAMMTLDFIKSLKWIDFPYVHFLRIYPGTDMVKIAVENGISAGAIERSADLAFHEYGETMPFPEEFAKMYQQKYFHEYFLVKERFIKMLQKQMKILTESELIQKYDSFFPTQIKDFSQLLDLVGITREDLLGAQFPAEDYMAVPDINKKLARIFPQKNPAKNALRILLLDVSQFFSAEAEMFYDVSEAPLGLMYLMTYLNEQYGSKINGKIAKSRMDFDSYEELHALVTDFNPGLIGVRALSHYKDFFHKTISLIRQWGINAPIIAGGPYATGSYAEVLKNGAVDVVVLGEGEVTFSEIIGKVLENNGKFPDEATLKEIKGIAFIEQGNKSIMRKINREIMFLDEAGEAFNREESRNLELPGRLADLAYIIYTSGSTGQPKGVTVEHKNLITYLNAFNNEFRVTAEDTVLQQASYSFDTFMEEVYPALLTGGQIIVPGKETVMDAYRLSDFIQKHKMTIVDCSPLLLHQLNKPDTSHSLESVRTFISGGDVLKGEYIDNLLNTGEVYNTYGPTEATICAAYYKCSGEEMTPYISIGKPIAGYNLYILDQNGGPVPIGVPGELCIAGNGVTRGYLNNPELTNSKFQRGWHPQPIRNYKATVGHPLSFSASQLLSFSLYRTGDLARWLPDGNIDFLGRLDHQVKIRGYRIELGEIQGRLLAHEKVLDAVVTLREDEQGDKYLCAYVVAWSMEHGAGRELESHAGMQLRDYLSRALPDYMVPAHFVQLVRIPLTSSGKVDFKALPDPLAEIEAGEGYTPPRDETEEKLVQVWSEVLGIDKGRIGINTSFFHLGGHSLKATLVVTRLHKDLDIKISLFEVFSRPTIRELAEYVRGTAADRHVPLEAEEKKEYYILSSAQKRLYIQQQRDLDTTAFNLPQVFVLEGDIKVDKLQKTFMQLIRRHESLRTSFLIIEDEPVQRLHKDVTFEIEYYDIINDFIEPFDLTKAPLLRVGLIKEAAQQHLLLIDLHHIISDAVSQGILVRDFITLFSGGELPFIAVQYKDFAQWQESPGQRKRIKQQETYWLKRFTGEIPCLNMPTDFERPEIQSFEGDILHFYVEGELYIGVRECMAETGTTLYMVLLGVYTILLSKYTRQQDIVVGSPVTGRTHDDLQNIMGMFVNMLPMRNQPSGDKTFREFLIQVKENALEAYDNQDYPFDELVIKLGLQGSSRPPVFETAFTLQDVELSGMAAREQGPAALRARPYDRFEHQIAQYDVTLDAIELKNSIHLWMRYVTALFRESTIETFKHYFLEILRQVVEKPDINIEDVRLSHEKIAVKSSIHKEDAGDFVF